MSGMLGGGSVGVGSLVHREFTPLRPHPNRAHVSELRQTDSSVSFRCSCTVDQVYIGHGQIHKF